MTLFSITQKIKYLIKAKGRHGIHSPFVYDFVEKILNGKLVNVTLHNSRCASTKFLNDKQYTLLYRMFAYYRFDNIYVDGKKLIINEKNKIELLQVDNELMSDECSVEQNDLVILLDIHSSQQRNLKWTKHYESSKVHLSLDIFEMGILLFRNDFLVKQHFVLKY